MCIGYGRTVEVNMVNLWDGLLFIYFPEWVGLVTCYEATNEYIAGKKMVYNFV